MDNKFQIEMGPEDFHNFVKHLNDEFAESLKTDNVPQCSIALRATVHDAKYPITGDGDPKLYGLTVDQYARAYEEFLIEEDVEPTPELVAIFARRQRINR